MKTYELRWWYELPECVEGPAQIESFATQDEMLHNAALRGGYIAAGIAIYYRDAAGMLNHVADMGNVDLAAAELIVQHLNREEGK